MKDGEKDEKNEKVLTRFYLCAFVAHLDAGFFNRFVNVALIG
jgi:hypothetical protein